MSQRGRIPAKDVKLIPHRWSMQAIQALVARDHELVARVFSEIPVATQAIDSRVKAYGFGSPMEFQSYGFVDSHGSISSSSTAVFDCVKSGDTLLAIALRQYDLLSAAALIGAGASITVANEEGETPIDMLFTAFSLLEHRKKTSNSDKSEKEAVITRVLDHEDVFKTLFKLVQRPLDDYHTHLKLSVREELTQIYTQFAPDRLSKITQQMEDFEYQERLLLESVRRKYL